MNLFWRVTVPVLVGAVLVAVAVGLANPVAERCADAQALATGKLSSEAAARYRSLLSDRSPTCAVNGLAISQAAGSSTQTSNAGTTTSSTVTTTTSAAASSGTSTTGSATVPQVVTETEGQSTAHTATSPQSSSPPSTKSNVPGGLPWVDGAREWIENLGLTTAGWVLLGAAALLLLRSGAEIYVSRRPGVVNIGTVTSAIDAGTLSANTDAVKAQLRQRFGSERLFGSPLVPGGSVPTLVAGALKDVNEPATQWMASLLKLLPSLLPQSGVTIDAAVRTGDSDPKCGCTLTVTDLASGRVLAIFTAWDSAVLKAVDRTSTEAIAFFLGRDAIRRRTPVWARFEPTSADALAQYVEGNDALGATPPDRDYAEARYRQALGADPGNLTIALRLGNAEEIRAASEKDPSVKALVTVGALRTYLRAGEIAENAFAPRYRQAVLIDQCSQLWDRVKAAASPPADSSDSSEGGASQTAAIEALRQMNDLGCARPVGPGQLRVQAIADRRLLRGGRGRSRPSAPCLNLERRRAAVAWRARSRSTWPFGLRSAVSRAIPGTDRASPCHRC
jgi:hypothetical protein